MVSSVSPFPSVTSADLSAHTIQAMVELVYCQTANDVLTHALASLQQGLTVTQTSLNTLAQLQGLKNDIKPLAKSTKFASIFGYSTTSVNNYEKTYTSAASAFFGTPINPAFYIGSTIITSAGSKGYSSFVVQLEQYRSTIAQQISYLSTVTPPLANGAPDPTTLLAKLKIVYNEIPSGGASYSAISKWVLDGYTSQGTTGIASAGNIQQHITDAISAGKSLNSSQQQKVQNYLFIFQQYYQSAAAVLTSLEQIIDRMAQAAGR